MFDKALAEHSLHVSLCLVGLVVAELGSGCEPSGGEARNRELTAQVDLERAAAQETPRERHRLTKEDEARFEESRKRHKKRLGLGKPTSSGDLEDWCGVGEGALSGPFRMDEPSDAGAAQ